MRDHGIGCLIDGVGKPDFESDLARQLMQMFRSEHVYISHFPAGELQMLQCLSEDGSQSAARQSAAYFERRMWHHDPTIDAGSRWEGHAPILTHLDTDHPETQELKHFYDDMSIGERIVAYGRGSSGHLGLSVVRTHERGAFDAEERARVGIIGDIVFPLLARHYALLRERDIFSSALESLSMIENCLALSEHNIPKREVQVIARILYGLTCEGISLDLSIAFETVITYKKRFYRRFNLSGFRDLVSWYLAQFSGAYYQIVSAQCH
ncbi:MAG: LuxR C-terminal-related transcriptional regulator [Sphingobium sp.]